MHQHSLGMMPSMLNTDPIPSVPICNWCTKRNDCKNVPKMTKNDPSMSVYSAFLHGLLKEPLLFA